MLYYGISPESFGQLGVWARQIRDCKDLKVEIKTKFVRPYCIAYLDQVVLQELENKTFSIASTYPEVNRYLAQASFEHLSPKTKLARAFPAKEIIAMKRFKGEPKEVAPPVVQWLEEMVKPFLPEHSPKLWKKVVENYWEIVHNGLKHGQGKFGVTTCGQFYPIMGYLEVAFFDAGHGIPKLVKEFLKLADHMINDCECINWAVQQGNSTCPLEESAGLGLHLLREFLRLNGGVFQIISGNGYFGQNSQEEPTILTLKNSIGGTLVNIRVVYDDNLYKLKGERV